MMTPAGSQRPARTIKCSEELTEVPRSIHKALDHILHDRLAKSALALEYHDHET